MNVMSESVSMKRKSKTPHCGACGPTAIPIRIKNGMLDKPSLLARATANAISPNARPISKMMLSTDSLPATFNQQSLQSVNCASVAGGDQCGSLVQNGMRFRVSARGPVGFDDRNDRRTGFGPNPELADSFANTRGASFKREPLQHEVA